MAQPRFVFHAYIEEDPDVGSYSSVCLENNVASLGDTPREALENLREAVHLYVKTRIKRGQFNMLVRPAPKGIWKAAMKIGKKLKKAKQSRSLWLPIVRIIREAHCSAFSINLKELKMNG